MAVISNFDIAQNLKVQMYLPDSANNVFVLGISKLDGPNVLGDDASGTYSWHNLEVEVNKVETDIGGSVASNVYFQANAGQARIQMQSWTLDPTNNPFIRPGVDVRLMLKNGAYERVIWFGRLDTVSVDYAADEPNQITINATDFWADVINNRFNYDPTGYGGLTTIRPSEVIELATQQMILQNAGAVLGYTNTVDPADEWNMTQTPADNITFGTLMGEVLNSGLGFTWVDPDDGELKYRARASSGVATYTIGNNHGDANHLCMADLTVQMASDDLYNNILVAQKNQYLTNPKFEGVYLDSDLIELYGNRAEDFTVDLATTDDADAWANALFVPRAPTHVQSVVTPAIDRQANLTEAVLFMPGDFIAIDFVTDEMDIQETYTATRVRHTIDVNNWFTTIELWKEF